ncbi:MAG: HAD-IA family hydrolase [Thermomicrobia bacterium]|nr:HAD-IA family hydrolase [Thermomicrobia bacterium]MCA1724614.1 HAD-IA family hydrolase [Thermomicrobia bacterium]
MNSEFEVRGAGFEESRLEPRTPNLEPPHAILFDLDGTLIDSIELIVRSFQHATAIHCGTPLARGEIIPTIGRSLAGELERIAPGNGAALLATYRTFMFANHDAFVTVYPGVHDLLAATHARGIPMGIVTSKARLSAAPSFARFLLDREMAVIVVEDDTARHKPHPDPLLHAAAALDLPLAACWYVGDSTHDMIAARAAGMTGIGAGWGPYGRAMLTPLADAIADTPRDVLALLEHKSDL